MTIKSYQMDIFNQAISIMEREKGGGIARKIWLLDRNCLYIPLEAIPKLLGELIDQQCCARNYALYYLIDNHEQSSIQTTKHYLEEISIDLKNNVKHLLKEVRKDANNAMQ